MNKIVFRMELFYDDVTMTYHAEMLSTATGDELNDVRGAAVLALGKTFGPDVGTNLIYGVDLERIMRARPFTR